jgi:predicted Zn finger-like uncharacterized protein
MPLMTRCSHCQTVFRITPEQLRAHGGRVRCGRCLQVFNGLETLVPEVPAPANAEATTPVPAAADSDIPAEAEARTVAGSAAVSAAGEPATAVPAEAPTELMALLPEPPATVPQEPLASEILGEAVAPKPEPQPQPALELEPQSQVEAPAADPVEEPAGNPFLQEDEPATAGPRRWLLAASVLLALVLGAQAVYFYRGDIAARHPQARQWLTAACEQMACTVPLPQSPKAVLIEASDLQLVDPARPERIQLTATLRNHAGHAVAYPALDLVLTNANDHTLARRIFLPAEYLGSGRDPRSGLAANAELTVRLALDTGNLGAAGFRLAVLAAPR